MKTRKQIESLDNLRLSGGEGREEAPGQALQVDGDFVAKKHSFRRKLGERITAFRERRGLRRVQLARQLGISASRLGKWEGGVHAPSAEYLLGLAAALSVSLEELMTGQKPASLRLSPAQRESLRPAVLLLMTLVGIGSSGREPEETKEP